MKIVVTGASGFLGAHLCRALAADGHAVTALTSRTCDLRHAGSLPAAAPDRYDRIYHLAAWTQAGDFCLKHPGEQWIINQQINTNVLAWWHTAQPQSKLIAIGSSCCYDPAQPHEEERFFDGRPTPSLFTYGMTKRMLVAGMMALAQQFGMKYLCVVPSTLYGPEYHLDGRQMHFIFDLMRKILQNHREGAPVELWGDGHQRREVIHVADFVTAMNRLADSVDNEIVNIGAGEDHSIREFAGLLCDIIGVDPASIRYDTTRYVGARSKFLLTAKLERLLPGVQRRPLREGLRETVAWLESAMYGEARR